MASTASAHPTPPPLPHAVLSGVRWTVWLAALTLPFSYGTRVVLARVGPAALADYGLLTVYINFTAAFLFLGGNAVAIRYLPVITRGQRRNFLSSYGLIIAVGWIPWLAVALWRPFWLSWLFGPLGRWFCLAMVALAPLAIASSLVLASLKAVLEITWSQWLYRGITVSVFAGYVLAAATVPGWLARHTAWLLWGWYLLLTGGVACLAWPRLRRYCPAARLRWYLPPGFWAYTGNLQLDSALGFLATQLDVIFVLRAAGMRHLGDYIALTGLMLLGIAALKLLLDSMMAALTNGVARSDQRLCGRVWHSYLGLIVPLLAAFGAGLGCLAVPLLSIYGAAYRHLAPALVCLAPGAALFGLNCVFGSVLSALGWPQDEVKAKLVRIAVFIAAFWPLWHAWGLTGAALCWTVAEAPYQAVNLWCLRRRAGFRLGLGRPYVALVVCLLITLLLGRLVAPTGLATSLLAWLAAMAGFFATGGYRRADLRHQLRVLLPVSLHEEWI